MKIKGKVVYHDIELGFWGIEGDNGNKYLPVNMPEQLKTSGARVEVEAKEVNAEMATMWGQPVQILSYHTLPLF